MKMSDDCVHCKNPARFRVAHRQYPTTIYSDEGVRTLPDRAVYLVCGVHLRVVKRRYPKALVVALDDSAVAFQT